jgi:hypothetical protein
MLIGIAVKCPNPAHFASFWGILQKARVRRFCAIDDDKRAMQQYTVNLSKRANRADS